MSVLKTQKEIEILREAGKRLAIVLDEVIKEVRVGVTEKHLNKIAEDLIIKGGDKPAFLNYTPEGASYPYPATLCTSVNSKIVHGIPEEYKLKKGDIIGLDIGLVHNGLIVDMAKTVPVGKIKEEDRELLKVTKEALARGIEAAKVGKHVGDISYAIGSYVKNNSNFSTVYELGGHGVGYKVHEPPFIANFGDRGTGEKLVDGMVLALEPIVNNGSGRIKVLNDEYTIETKDGKRSAQFEHTILITKRGTEIITKI